MAKREDKIVDEVCLIWIKILCAILLLLLIAGCCCKQKEIIVFDNKGEIIGSSGLILLDKR